MSSTVRPQQRMATVWPPIGLPEPGVIARGQHAARDRVAEPLVGRVDRVEHPDVGLDRAGQLVGVVARPALALLARAEVGVRVDEPGQHPLAGRVDDVGAGRRLEVGAADGRDLAVDHQDRPAVDWLALDGNDVPARDRDAVCLATPAALSSCEFCRSILSPERPVPFTARR